MKLKKIKNKGMTLLEVIIGIAISSIIIMGVFNFGLFANRAYKAGTSQYDLQSNVRIAMDKISKDVRFARDVQVLTKDWNYELDKKYSYIYVSKDQKSLMIKKEGSDTPVKLLEGNSKNAIYELDFKALGDNDLSLMLSVDDNGKKFEVNSSETILNIHRGFYKRITNPGEVLAVGESNVKGVKYKKSSVIVVPGESKDVYLNADNSWYDFEMYNNSADSNGETSFMRIVVIFNSNITVPSNCKYTIKYTDGTGNIKNIVNDPKKPIQNIETTNKKLEVRVPLNWVTGDINKTIDERKVTIYVSYNKNGSTITKPFNFVIN